MSRSLGGQAEQRAAALLEAKGYVILERNFTAKVGELDLVARHGDTIVFVEVRSRGRSEWGTALESITPAKQRKLIKTARYYAMVKRLDCPMRFDVVAEGPSGLEHLESAFWA